MALFKSLINTTYKLLLAKGIKGGYWWCLSKRQFEFDNPCDLRLYLDAEFVRLQEAMRIVCDIIEPSSNVTHNAGGINLPSELDTDRAKKYFARAVEVGYMSTTGNAAQWHTAVARLGYLCNKIYPQPRPIASLERYFGVTKLSAAITQASYEAKRADVKKWRAEIDSKIFFD